MAVDQWYDFHEFGCHLGNVGQELSADRAQQRRAERTALTTDMWEAINAGWLDLNAYDGARMARDTLNRFLAAVNENGGDKLVHGSGGISQPRAE